jgi:cytochrome c biogenesis protein CcmG/thiol:disulfide interchange protein DsbE
MAPRKTLIALIAALAGLTLRTSAATAQPVVGAVAPEFAIATSAGPFDLARTNRPVVLEIFATWCPHCRHEAPILSDLDAHLGTTVAFIGVSGSDLGMDRMSPASQADVTDFAKTFGASYPVAYDPSLQIAKRFFDGGYPTIVIIGADKRIKAVLQGEVPEDVLANAIHEALTP